MTLRRRKLGELIAAGWSYERIFYEADLGYTSIQAVRTDWARLRAEARRPAEEDRDRQRNRLEGLLSTYYPAGRRGDSRAAEVALKLLQREAALLGLDYRIRGDSAAVSDVDAWLSAVTGDAEPTVDPDPDEADALPADDLPPDVDADLP